MAVRVRRGLKADFDPNKLVEGEPAAPLDTRELYIAFAPGDVQKLATHENVREMVDEVTEEVVADLTEGVNNATDYANTQGDYANTQGDYAKNQGDYAKDQGDYAKAQGQAAEAVVLGDIATDTIAGIVKGGGNIEIGQDGEMNYNMTGDTKDNTATFAEATEDTDITSGETHSTIFGKILKSIKTLRYNIGVLATEKIDKSAIVNQDAINDVNKVPSSAVTYAHGQAITQLNNNLTMVKSTSFIAVLMQEAASGELSSIPIYLKDAFNKNISIAYFGISDTVDLSEAIPEIDIIKQDNYFYLQTSNATVYGYKGRCFVAQFQIAV